MGCDDRVRRLLYHEHEPTLPRTTLFYALEGHPETVQACLNREPLDDLKLDQFSKDLMKGLLFLKNNQVVHMDMKPDNLLISRDGRLVITDFGEGILVDRESRAAVGFVGGNLRHHSPEICNIINQSRTMSEENKVLIDFTPQYSWEAGTILYELCCRQFPFENYPLSGTNISSYRLNLECIPPRFREVIRGLLVERKSLEYAAELIHKV